VNPNPSTQQPKGARRRAGGNEEEGNGARARHRTGSRGSARGAQVL